MSSRSFIALLLGGGVAWYYLAEFNLEWDETTSPPVQSSEAMRLGAATHTANTKAKGSSITITVSKFGAESATSSARAFLFDALTAARRPDKVEARMFQAQKWEPDLAKAFSLPPGTLLERRSTFYDIPELKFHRVRVDRVYRTDKKKTTLHSAGAAPVAVSGNGVLPSRSSPGADASATAPSSPATPPFTAPTENGTQANSQTTAPSTTSDATEGELLWDNAMVADHLMVQTQPGISREQFVRALPRGCRILSAVNAEKGLYLVAVPDEGERSLERAALALNHESLKKTIWFAEPDFLMGGADTTPNDPLFTTSTTELSKQWGLAKIMAPRAWDVIKQPISRQVPNGSGGTLTISASVMASTTVVAVVDTGVDYTHPDLIPNLYLNPGESGGGKESNGLDDDANGKIDDYRGWNFVENTNNPMDDVGHGTHVAGIIGAAGNNAQGGSGVCWGVKMLPLRIIKKVGSGTYGVYSDAVAALNYLRTLNSPTKRIAVANHSWGGNGYSLAMLNAVNNPLLTADPLPDGVRGTYEHDSNVITVTGTATELSKLKIGMEFGGIGIPEDTVITIIESGKLTLSNYSQQKVTNQLVCFANPIKPKPYGIVHVAAAGNSRFNADRVPTYPASLPSGFMMSVGATDENDVPAVWVGSAGSNYGRLNVDLFAPGSSIWSTKWKAPGEPTYSYESRNGTSMAAPFVTASIALLKLWQPLLTDLQARQIVIDNADVLPALKDKCLAGGRLNLAKVVDKLYQPTLLASGGGTGGAGSTIAPMSGPSGVFGRAAQGQYTKYAIVGGKVMGWGNISAFSVDDLTDSAVPKEVPGLSDPLMIAASFAAAYALMRDGTVYSWGGNTSGALGRGLPPGGGDPAPAQIAGLSDVIWLACSEDGTPNCYAIEADGSVKGWGHDPLGNGTSYNVPTPVPGLDDVVLVAAGNNMTAALHEDGTVHVWGTGIPFTLVAGVAEGVWVAAGAPNFYVLARDGTVTRISESNLSPVTVTALPYAIALDASSDRVMAIDGDGKITVWGGGSLGYLGNGADVSIGAPSSDFQGSQVLLDENQMVTALDCGVTGSILVDSEGKVMTWGRNDYGQLGIGTSGTKRYPTRCYELDRFVKIEGCYRSNRCCAMTSLGTLYWWGGINSPTSLITQAPQPVPFLREETFFDFAIGVTNSSSGATAGDFVLAIRTDGVVRAWGDNTSGVLGDGTTTERRHTAVTVIGLSGVTAVAASRGEFYFTSTTQPHCLALMAGTVKAWGGNDLGQLGNGTTTGSMVPVNVTGLANIVQIACGEGFSVALDSSGAVWSWGGNDKGQLGLGDTINRFSPTIIPFLSGITSITADYKCAWAVKQDGSVWTWGLNGEGGTQRFLGIGDSPALVTTPLQIPTVTDASRVFAPRFGFGSFIVRQDGTVLAWGSDRDYLGVATDQPASPTTPKPVIALSGVSAISGGTRYKLAVGQSQAVHGWGTGSSGVFADGEAWSNRPVEVVTLGGASQSTFSLGAFSTQDSWMISNFSLAELVDQSLIGDIADPDGDGIENLLEYALGLDPNEHDLSGLPAPRLDAMTAQSTSESAGGGGTIQLFSVDDCCFAAPVGLDAGKHYMAFTVERREGIRTDIDYIIEVSNDIVTWRSGTPDVLTVINTGELLEAYSTTAIENQPRQFMRLRIRRK